MCERCHDDRCSDPDSKWCSDIILMRLQAGNAALRKLVAEQAEDEGLWFIAQTAPEAYLQQALRKIHVAIEGDGALLAGKSG